MKALVVENSHSLRTLVARLLRESGAAVELCASVEQGLAQGLAEAFDLVCIGDHLRDGTAIDFARAYRSEHVEPAPIVAITADETALRARHWARAGITDCLRCDDPALLAEEIARFVADRVTGPRGGDVLYVADPGAGARTTAAGLEDAGYRVVQVNGGNDALDALGRATPRFDLILIDALQAGPVNRLALVRSLRRRDSGESTSILAVAGPDDSQRVEILRAGADDCVTEPPLPEVLLARVHNLVSRKRATDEVRQQRAMLLELASRDVLTGCLNHRSLSEFAPKLVAQARRDRRPLSLAVIDLDRFQRINDEWGPAMGDLVLTQVGSMLNDSFREGDLVTRFGGDEFIVLLANCTAHDARVKAEQIRERLESLRPEAPCPTASIGIATLEHDEAGGNFDLLFSIADAAVHRAKHNGRNRVAVGNIVIDRAESA